MNDESRKLAEVAARRRRQRRLEGEVLLVTLRKPFRSSHDNADAVTVPVRASGGQFTGADVYRAIDRDVANFAYPLLHYDDTIRLYPSNVPARRVADGRDVAHLVRPGDTFSAGVTEFFVVRANRRTPGWNPSRGWVEN